MTILQIKRLFSTQFGDKFNNGGAFVTSFFSCLVIVSCSSPHERAKNVFPIPLIVQYVMSAVSARNLGLMFDNNFNFREQISHICQTC